MINDPDPEAKKYFDVAYELQQNGQWEDAVLFYQRSIDIQPTAEAHTFLGWTYSYLHRLDDAIRECETAIALDPEYGNPYNDIGAYLIEKGEWDEAIPWLQKAKQAKRYDYPEFPCVNLGKVFEQKHLWEKAISEYSQALQLRRDCLAAHFSLMRLKAQTN